MIWSGLRRSQAFWDHDVSGVLSVVTASRAMPTGSARLLIHLSIARWTSPARHLRLRPYYVRGGHHRSGQTQRAAAY